MLREVVKTAISRLEKAWKDTPPKSAATPIPFHHPPQRGRPRKIVTTPTQSVGEVAAMFKAVKDHTVSEWEGGRESVVTSLPHRMLKADLSG